MNNDSHKRLRGRLQPLLALTVCLHQLFRHWGHCLQSHTLVNYFWDYLAHLITLLAETCWRIKQLYGPFCIFLICGKKKKVKFWLLKKYFYFFFFLSLLMFYTMDLYGVCCYTANITLTSFSYIKDYRLIDQHSFLP